MSEFRPMCARFASCCDRADHMIGALKAHGTVNSGTDVNAVENSGRRPVDTPAMPSPLSYANAIGGLRVTSTRQTGWPVHGKGGVFAEQAARRADRAPPSRDWSVPPNQSALRRSSRGRSASIWSAAQSHRDTGGGLTAVMTPKSVVHPLSTSRGLLSCKGCACHGAVLVSQENGRAGGACR